jgi:hypothetical protein
LAVRRCLLGGGSSLDESEKSARLRDCWIVSVRGARFGESKSDESLLSEEEELSVKSFREYFRLE